MDHTVELSLGACLVSNPHVLHSLLVRDTHTNEILLAHDILVGSDKWPFQGNLTVWGFSLETLGSLNSAKSL